jgi:hypothetical protein
VCISVFSINIYVYSNCPAILSSDNHYIVIIFLDPAVSLRYHDACSDSIGPISARAAASGNRTEAKGQLTKVPVKRSFEGMAYQTICPGRAPQTSLLVRRRRMKRAPFFSRWVSRQGRVHLRGKVGSRCAWAAQILLGGVRKANRKLAGGVSGRRRVHLGACRPAICRWLRSDSSV